MVGRIELISGMETSFSLSCCVPRKLRYLQKQGIGLPPRASSRTPDFEISATARRSSKRVVKHLARQKVSHAVGCVELEHRRATLDSHNTDL